MVTGLDYIELGRRIRKYRHLAGLTQERLAEQVDMATSNISHIERATTQVSLPSLVKIANALGVSLDILVCDSLPAAPGFLDRDIGELIRDCTPGEKRIVRNIVEATVRSLRENVK